MPYISKGRPKAKPAQRQNNSFRSNASSKKRTGSQSLTELKSPQKPALAYKSFKSFKSSKPSQTAKVSSTSNALLSTTKPSFLIVAEDQDGQRIDNYLTSRLKGLPKSRLYRLLRKGEVRVAKKRIKPDYRLQAGDEIRLPPLRLSEESHAKPISVERTADLMRRIIFEDDRWIILNKPSGMAVHGGSGVSFGVIEAMRHACIAENKTSAAVAAAGKLELAHRLDKDTSGCLVLSKRPSALKTFHTLLRAGEVEKIYWALVRGHWPAHLKKIDAPLQKFELKSGERMVAVNEEGKEALTEFKILKRYADTTLLEVTLRTGRTHQIRVHTAHAGYPVVGDEKYGDKIFNKQMRASGCKRLFLHASKLRFVVPEPKQVIAVEAALDSALQEVLDKMNNINS